MLLENKTAVIFGAGGAIGKIVAKVFAYEGATVFLSGRHETPIEDVAKDIRKSEGQAYVSKVDALSEKSIFEYLQEVSKHARNIDIALNAIGIQPTLGCYGTSSLDIPYHSFLSPLNVHVGSQFLTARTAAKYMVHQKSGVILTLSSIIGTLPTAFMTGISAACAAIEGMTRSLAAEFGPVGVRVVCLRPGGMYETRTMHQTFGAVSKTLGIKAEELAASYRQAALLKRPVTLQETAELAAFLVSEKASAITGQTVDVSCGLVCN